MKECAKLQQRWKKLSNRRDSLLKFHLFLLIILLNNNIVFATTDANRSKKRVLIQAQYAEETANNLLEGLLSVNTEFNTIKETLSDTKKALALENNITKVSLKKINDLQVILDKEREFIGLLNSEHKKYNDNINKYIYENSAKKYLPFLYSLALMLNSSNQKLDDLALRFFAGYGIGTLVEESGYGLTGISSWMIYGSWKF